MTALYVNATPTEVFVGVVIFYTMLALLLIPLIWWERRHTVGRRRRWH